MSTTVKPRPGSFLCLHTSTLIVSPLAPPPPPPAGLFYGNWITQEAVLQACGTVSAGQCLVNVNEEGAATALAFNIARFAPSGPTAYLNFIKTHLAAGHPIIGTWYEAGATDPDYDHITPITGCTVDAT